MKIYMVLAMALTAVLGAQSAQAGCVEGNKGTVLVQDDNGRHYSEFRICKNGTYMTDEEKAAYVYNPRTKCVEGSKGTISLQDNNGRTYTEFRICKNGTYMNAAEKAAYIYNPSFKCRVEGKREVWTVQDTSSDRSKSVVMVCLGNKWVPAK